MYDLIEKSCLFIINTLYHQTIFCFILFLLIFGITFILKEKSPLWQLGLWFLILIRLILPIDLSLSFSARNLVDDFLITDSLNASIEKVSEKLGVNKQPDQNWTLNVPMAIEEQDNNRTPVSWKLNEDKNTPLSWPVILSAAWFLGCMVFLFLFLKKLRGINLVLKHSLIVREKEIAAFVDSWSESFKITRPVTILYSDKFLSPFTTGFLRPKIFIPKPILEDMDNETINSIIAHEMVHIKRFDHLWIRLQNALQIIYFFNPFVWYANWQINIARERVCDSVVLSKQAIPPKGYGESIMDVLKFNLSGYRLVESLPCFSNHKKIFEYRIKDILKEKTMSKQKTLCIFLVVCLLGFFLLPMSSAQLDVKDSETSDVLLSSIAEKPQTTIGSNKGVNEVQDDMKSLRDSIDRIEAIDERKSEETKAGDKQNYNETKDKTLDLPIDEGLEQKEGIKVYLPRVSHENTIDYEEPLKLATNQMKMNSSKNMTPELDESEPEQDIVTPEAVQQPQYSHVDYKSRGMSLLKKGQIEDAISDLTRAIELNPDDAENYLFRGSAYYKKGKFDKAIADYRKVIELNPENAESVTRIDQLERDTISTEQAFYNASKDSFDQGRFEESMEGFKEFLDRYPNSELAENAQYWVGECYMALKKYDRAIAVYEDVKKKFPEGNKIPDAMLKQAMAFLEKGDETSTRILLKRIVNAFPESDQARVAEQRLETLK